MTIAKVVAAKIKNINFLMIINYLISNSPEYSFSTDVINML